MEQIDALPSVSKHLLMGSICAFWGMNLGAKYMFKSYLDPQGFLCHPTITSARYMSPTGGKNTSKKMRRDSGTWQRISINTYLHPATSFLILFGLTASYPLPNAPLAGVYHCQFNSVYRDITFKAQCSIHPPKK